MAVDGSLIFNTKIDTSGLNSDIARINKAIEAAQSKAQAGAKTTAQTAQNATQQVSNSADKIVDEVKNNTSDIGAQIQNIIADTERSAKSKAMSIASILKRTGMTQAEAMQAAWDKVNSSVSQQVKKTNSEVEQETEKTGKNIKENTDLYSKQVLDVLKSIDKNVADSSKNISEKVQKAVTLSASKAKQSLTTVRTAVDRLQSKAKMIGRTLLTAFGTAAVVSFGKESIELGSDLAEVQNVVDVTFSHMSASVDDWAKSAQKAYGLSETMAKKYVGTFGSMAEAFGFTEQQAFDMSTSLTALTGDVASFYNITQDEAHTKLKSVFSGETETLKDLGIVMTQNALDNYAMANGWGKTTSAMTEAEKVTLRYNFVLGQLSNATGDFARTQNSWANQTRILQLQFDSIKATIGQGLINAFTPLLNCINQFISRLSVAAQKFKDFTAQVFGYSTATSNATSSAVSDMSDLASQADSSTSEIEKTSEAAEDLKKNLAGFDELNVMSDTSDNSSDTSTQAPSSEIKSMQNALEQAMLESDRHTSKTIDNIVNSLDKVKNACVTIKNSWEKVWNNGTGEKVLENINSLINTFVSTVGDIAEAFTNAWDKAGLGDSVVQSFIDKWNSLVELLNTVGDTFRQVWNDGKGEKIWSNILEIIRNCNNYTETLRTKIKDAWEKNDKGKKIWENILGIVEDITGFLDDMSQIRLEWLEDLNLDPVAKAVETLSGAFRELLKACGDKLKQAYKTILLPLAKWTIEKVVPDLLNAFAGALKDISDIIEKISPSVLKAVAVGISAVATAVITFKTGKAIASGISEVTSAVKNISSVISANPLLVIASAITGIVLAVQAYNDCRWSNSEAKKFCDELQVISDDLQGTCDGITEKIENTLNTLDQNYAENTLIDNYQEKLETLLNKAELSPSEMAQLQTIVTYFEDNVDGFKDTWDRYVEISDGNTVNLKGNLGEVSSELNNLIDNYQKTANAAALSALQQENALEKITATKNLSEVKETMSSKMKEIDSAYTQLEKKLSSRGYTMNDFFQSYGTINGGINFREESQMYDDIKEMCNAYDDLKEQYNEATAKVNELTMTNDDLIDVQKVLNGDYSDAAAVLMAYNQQMISQNDILSATDENGEKIWKSLSDVKVAAEDSGKNTVIGLVKGTQTYKDALVKNSNGLANIVLSEYDSAMGINSPSKEMYKRGQYTVLGLVNGLSDTGIKVQSVITMMLKNISKALEPIKTVFSNVFEPLYNIIKKPLNNVLTGLENFINGFISAINKMLSGVDTVANSIGKLFGQEWHAGRLDKVHIPKLATGTYVPANYGEFLAVLGDNKREAEVVSPISAMKQAMAEVLAEYGGTGNSGDIHITLTMPDGRVLFEAVADENNKIKKRTGRSAFA